MAERETICSACGYNYTRHGRYQLGPCSNENCPLDKEQSLFQLTISTQERQELRDAIKAQTSYMRSDALRAREAGATVAQIGEACGMSRQAVYDLWKNDKEEA